MARKKNSGETSVPGKGGARRTALECLDTGEAATVLKLLLQRHPELSSEAEQLARGQIASVSVEEIASDVLDRVSQVDLEALNGRAGSHSWGYVEPTEAAEELLTEAVQDVVDEMARQLELRLTSEAEATCLGLVVGLYRARTVKTEGGLDWAPDWPQLHAEEMVCDYVTSHEQSSRSSCGNRLLERLKDSTPEWISLLQSAIGRAVKA